MDSFIKESHKNILLQNKIGVGVNYFDIVIKTESRNM